MVHRWYTHHRMPTSNLRVNLSLPDEMRKPLQQLAKRDGLPLATKALRLLLNALEIEEDAVFMKIVNERKKSKQKNIPHAKAWL